jgi:hypothetical protein
MLPQPNSPDFIQPYLELAYKTGILRLLTPDS